MNARYPWKIKSSICLWYIYCVLITHINSWIGIFQRRVSRSWNASLWKTNTRLSYIVDNMVIKALAACFARTAHYSDVIMSAMASQITSVTIVYSTVCSDADQTTHQSSASLAFVREIHRWPVNSPPKGPVTRKMFSFDGVIMSSHGIGQDYVEGSVLNTRRMITDPVAIMKNLPVNHIRWYDNT